MSRHRHRRPARDRREQPSCATFCPFAPSKRRKPPALLQQCDVSEPRGLGGVGSEAPCHLIERGRNRYDDLALRELPIPSLRTLRVEQRVSEILQVTARAIQGREFLLLEQVIAPIAVPSRGSSLLGQNPCFTSPKIAWSCYFRPVPPVTEKPKMSNLSPRKGARIENDVAHKLNQLCRPLREADAATLSKAIGPTISLGTHHFRTWCRGP